MIKKIYISTILLIGLFSYSSVGQGSAQATMRISVTVVSGSSFDIEKPEIVHLSNNEKSDLGTINFKGIDKEGVFVKNADKIFLTDKSGNQVTMSINTHKKEDEESNSIRFEGTSEGQFLSNMYQGELTTSIVYL